MRGTLDTTKEEARDIGIIPAHAGNTSDCRPGRNRAGDHPRACGEHSLQEFVTLCMLGSSPRMRGTRCRGFGFGGGDGIIPAHAGNTPTWARRQMKRKDHPRACGEHVIVYEHVCGWKGSSPRMRGTRRSQPLASMNYGIIPAHAGNTRNGKRAAISSRDHPRACGEHFDICIAEADIMGSSPRMRGTPQVSSTP